MKKILIMIAVIFNTIMLLSINLFAASGSNNLYLHYYRFDGNYSNWNVWLWQHEPDSLEGSAYNFVDDQTDEAYNFGGKVVIIDLDEVFPDATQLGIIIRKGDWQEKDIDNDRFIDLGDRNNKHFYFVEGDPLIGTSIDDPQGPSKEHKFKKVQFVDDNKIEMVASTEIDSNKITLFKNEFEITSKISNISLSDNKEEGTLTLSENLDYTATYEIKTTFLDQDETTQIVSFEGMYDKDSFNDSFYTDEELGAIYSLESTTFKVWAPLASEVKVNIYNTGTPSNLGGNDTKEVHDLVKGDKGVFSITLEGDYHGKYYTYDVKNGMFYAKEIVDPYAKGVGVNGLRGLVIDFARTNPAGWNNFTKPDNIEHKTDSIIYELHVRDLTTHETWNGSEENRGLYLGLIEEGTRYNTLTTGFDHIKELGITHLQLLPIFDYGNAIDETRQNDDDYNSFNWGYMPLNFNALEGNYSKDPYDGLLRINEFKQVVMGYGEAGIRINMDVVYNHTGQSADSNFNLIVPGYYHRFTDSGAFSNGSGTGNETASERSMVRKFIVDSVLFWAEEYKLGGFRFDLMALHDLETMIEISEKLHQLDPKILVYGEPWMGGTSTLPASEQSGKENLKDLSDVGAFNDDTRDGIKGSVFSSWAPGFIQGDFAQKNKIKYGIVGGIQHVDNPGYNVWHTSPDKILNYVTAHDNNTLHDKLYLSLVDEGKLDLIEKMSIQAHGLILTSQGIAFIHAGDEFLRSKEIGKGVFDSNSYQSSDEINQIRWDLKAENINHLTHFTNLLNLRNENKVFRKHDNEDINQNIRFIFNDMKGVIAYVLYEDDETFVVIVNATNDKYKFKTDSSNFEVIIDGADQFEMMTLKAEDKNEFEVEPHSILILKTNKKVPLTSFPEEMSKVKKVGLTLYLILGITGGLLITGMTTLILFRRRKTI